MPTISVIVPVYKVEPYLRECVDSILNQTFGDFELILIDDGSPDRCPDICDNYKKIDERIIVVHKENGGLSSSRNAGLDIARGDYISFIDGDDYVDCHFLNILYKRIKDTNSDCVACNFARISENGNLLDENSNSREFVISAELYYDSEYNDAIFMVAWNKLYKASIFEKLRYPVGKIHEDEFVIDRIIYKSKKIAYTPKPLYFYRQRPGSIMQTENNLEKTIVLMELYYDKTKFFSDIENLTLSNKYYIRAFNILIKNYKCLHKNKDYKIIFFKMKKIYKKRKKSKTESLFYFSPCLYFFVNKII